MNSKLATIIILLLLTLVISGGASAEFNRNSVLPSPLLAPIGNAFTYQGSLIDGGSPANGDYDFEFYLFDDQVAGVQLGSTINLQDVSVSDGLFSVELDFVDVFDGTAMWLEIRVRPGAATGGYQQLLPRQPLTAVPYANFALGTGELDGQDGSYYQNADNINAGMLDESRFSAYSDLSDEGHFNTDIQIYAVTNSACEERYNITLKDECRRCTPFLGHF